MKIIHTFEHNQDSLFVAKHSTSYWLENKKVWWTSSDACHARFGKKKPPNNFLQINSPVVLLFAAWQDKKNFNSSCSLSTSNLRTPLDLQLITYHKMNYLCAHLHQRQFLHIIYPKKASHITITLLATEGNFMYQHFSDLLCLMPPIGPWGCQRCRTPQCH